VPGILIHCYKLVTPLNSYDKSHAMGKPMQGTGQNGHTVILPLPAGTRQTCMLNTMDVHLYTIRIDIVLPWNDFYLLEYTVPTITTHTFPAYLTCKLQLSEPTVTALTADPTIPEGKSNTAGEPRPCGTFTFSILPPRLSNNQGQRP
jgi:hypothetical protein